MADSTLVVLLLASISLCGVILTVTIVRTTGELRRTLSRFNELHPTLSATLQHTRRLVASTEAVTRQVEALVMKGSGAASEMLDEFLEVKHRVESFMHTHLNGNGHQKARRGARRRVRRR